VQVDTQTGIFQQDIKRDMESIQKQKDAGSKSTDLKKRKMSLRVDKRRPSLLSQTTSLETD